MSAGVPPRVGPGKPAPPGKTTSAASPPAPPVGQPVSPAPAPAPAPAAGPAMGREELGIYIRAQMDASVAPLLRAVLELERRVGELERKPGAAAIARNVGPATSPFVAPVAPAFAPAPAR